MKQQLFLDVGNTALKYGVHNGQQWTESGTVRVEELEKWQPPKGHYKTAIHGCSVTSKKTNQRIAHQLGQTIHWLHSEKQFGEVLNGYQQVQQLGNDRWAALLGTRWYTQDKTIIVLAGTATAVDILDSNGHHLGGVIIPGIYLMAQSLATATNALPDITTGLNVLENIAEDATYCLPNNTHSAIEQGIIRATVALVEILAQQFNVKQCIVSGGNTDYIASHLTIDTLSKPQLILDGVRIRSEQ